VRVLCRSILPSAIGALALGAPSSLVGQSPAIGRWEGVARVPGQGVLKVEITLDSNQAGWQGLLRVPARRADPFPFAAIERVQDSLILRLPADAQNAVFRLGVSSDGQQLGGVIQAGAAGTVTLARAGTPAAAALVGPVTRVDSSRAAATRLAQTRTPVAAPTPNPDSAHLVTSDIRLFWSVLDHAPGDSLAEYLQREYLEKASVGVRDFIPGRIMSAEDLAAYVRANRATYDSVRAANLDVTRAEPAIRAAFHKLKDLYPDAVYPDVYFVVGRFNSGGTSSDHGLLIGAEMYRDPARLPSIVSHELIHYQQHYDARPLLEHAFMEGTADFVGEMISGTQTNNAAHQYGMAHEAELWAEFRKHFDDTDYFPWMYGKPPDGKPNDLAYFIGYRIAQAYYDKAADKKQAIRDIITARGGKVRELLAMSGYAPDAR
jgi:hypothetical protein